MEYLSRSRLPVFTPRLDLTAEDLNAEAETLCAAINEIAGRLFIIKDMIPEEERAQYAEEQSYPILDEIKRIWEDIQRAWETIAKNKEECEAHYQETLAMIAELDERLNKLIQDVKQELLDVIDAVDKKHDDEEERIENKFDISFADLEKRFNALDDAAARKADLATVFDRLDFIQKNSLPTIGTNGNWFIGKVDTGVEAHGPVGPGVPSGGSTGQILRKKSGDDFDTEWVTTTTDMDLYYTKEEADDLINSKISTTFKYKGTKANYAAIQAVTNPAVGDVWNDASTDHNYVWNGSSWDKLSGTVDMTNYYTMDEAEAMVDNKINNIPVNDLLHYKGHVDTIEELPSLGQPSANVSNPNLVISNYEAFSCSSINTSWVATALSKFNSMGKAFFVATGRWHSDSYDRVYSIIATDYPECIDGIYVIGPSSRYIHVTYDVNKPVYTSYSGSVTDYVLPIEYDDGTSGSFAKNSTNNLVTKSGWVYFGGDTNFIGNINKLKYKVCDLTTLHYHWYASSTTTNSKYKSITTTINGSNYTWDGNSYLYSFESNYYPKLITAETDTKLNDMYTVGDLKTMFRRTENITWEKWSDFKEFSTTTMTEADYIELEDKNGFDLYVLDRVAEVTETTNLLLNSITGDVDLVEANISEEEALAITNEIIGGVSDE